MLGIFHSNLETFFSPGGGENLTFALQSAFAELGVKSVINPNSYNLIDNSPIHFIGTSGINRNFLDKCRSHNVRIGCTPLLFKGKYNSAKSALSHVPFNKFYRRRELLQKFDYVIATTSVEKTYLEQVYGLNEKKVHTIHNGISDPCGHNLRSFSEIYDIKNYLLMVGRVTPLKRQLEVVKWAIEKNINIVVIGPPDLSFSSYVDELNYLEKKFKNFLWVKGLPHNSPMLNSAFQNANMHILNSLSEVSPLVCGEALLNGCLSLSIGHDTVKSMYLNHCTYFKNIPELESCVENLNNLTKNEEIKKKNEGQNFIRQNFQWSQIANQYLQVILRKND